MFYEAFSKKSDILGEMDTRKMDKIGCMHLSHIGINRSRRERKHSQFREFSTGNACLSHFMSAHKQLTEVGT